MNKLLHTYEDGKLKVILNENIQATDFEEINVLLDKCEDVKYLGIDMHNCVYIQSKILAELIALKKLSMAHKFDIALLNVNENILQVLEMASLVSFFTIEDDFSVFDINNLCDHFLDPMEAQYISDYLADNYNEEIKSKLSEIILSNDPVRAEYAIITMGRAQDYSSVELIRKELDNPARNVKHAALLVLGWLGDTESKNKIYTFLDDADFDLSEAAVASIALLSDETDSEKIGKYLNSPDEHTRRSAVQALAIINDEYALQLLKEVLKKENNETVRVAIVRALASFNREGVREILIKLFDDPSIAVREAAASGIVRIGPKEYVDTILAKVPDKDSWVGFFAAKSLGGCCGPKEVEKLISYFNDVDQNVKLAILEVLGKSKSDSTDFLLSKIEDDNEDIRKEALNALDNSSSPKAIETALHLFETDKSWLVRYKAVEMIIAKKPADYIQKLKHRLPYEDNRYVREKLLAVMGE